MLLIKTLRSSQNLLDTKSSRVSFLFTYEMGKRPFYIKCEHFVRLNLDVIILYKSPHWRTLSYCNVLNNIRLRNDCQGGLTLDYATIHSVTN